MPAEKEVSGKFKECVRTVSKKCKKSFKDASRKFQDCFNEDSMIFQESFKVVSRKIEGFLRKNRVFERSFKGSFKCA